MSFSLEHNCVPAVPLTAQETLEEQSCMPWEGEEPPLPRPPGTVCFTVTGFPCIGALGLFLRWHLGETTRLGKDAYFFLMVLVCHECLALNSAGVKVCCLIVTASSAQQVSLLQGRRKGAFLVGLFFFKKLQKKQILA